MIASDPLDLGAPNTPRGQHLDRTNLFSSAFTVGAIAYPVGVTEVIVRRWELGTNRRCHVTALVRKLSVSLSELAFAEPHTHHSPRQRGRAGAGAR